MDQAGTRLADAAASALDGGAVEADGMWDVEAAPVGEVVARDILARRLPKAELHLHFSGALPLSTTRRLAAAAGMSLPERPTEIADYRGFGRFIAALMRNVELIDTRAKATGAAADVLDRAVDVGCRHLELMVTLSAWIDAGWDALELLAALTDAFDEARALHDLTGGIIVEADRSSGPERAVEMATLAGDARERGLAVVGFGNDGDPLTVPFGDLAPGYERAREFGLKLCGHVDLPTDVAPALDLGLDRIDHGYPALFQPELLDRIVAEQVPMTVCVTSNLVQMPGIFADWKDHPVGALIDAGANVTLNTDDPPYFFTDLAQEYRTAAEVLGWDAAAMGGAAKASLRAAWLDPAGREGRLARLEGEIDEMVADPRITGRATGATT